MDLQTVVINFLIGLAGSLIGAYVGYRVTKGYAEQASEELRAETDRLRRLIDTTLLALQSMGAKIGRNERGEHTGGVGFSESFPTRRLVKGSSPSDSPAEEEDPGYGEGTPRTAD